MTAYELIQRLAKFPPDTKIVHAADWSDDVVLSDYTDIAEGEGVLALSTSISDPVGSASRVEA